MQRFKMSVVFTAAFTIMLLTAVPAQAEPAITAEYQVVAVQPTAGGSLVSLDVTVTNSGTEALGSVVLEDVDPTHQAPANNSLAVGNLAVGVRSVALWTLTTSIPADQVPSSLPLYLQAQAVDANGNPIAVAVEGVAK